MGEFAAFSCTTQAPVSSVQWIVNGSLLENINLNTVISPFPTGEALQILNVPLHFNGTTIQCDVNFTDGTDAASNIAILIVQGIKFHYYYTVSRFN